MSMQQTLQAVVEARRSLHVGLGQMEKTEQGNDYNQRSMSLVSRWIYLRCIHLYSILCTTGVYHYVITVWG